MYCFNSRVRYSECDHKGRLSLEALLNYFQDCSTFHSEDIGVGLAYVKEHGIVWVLSSWQIDVLRYPDLCEEIEIGTFPYEFKGCFGYRNFIMKTKEGEVLARANTLWTLLNLNTMKPARLTPRMQEAYVLEEKLEMRYEDRKVHLAEHGRNEEEIQVKKHHLDTNNHVNNGQYVDMGDRKSVV